MHFSLYYSYNDFSRSRAGQVFVNRAAKTSPRPSEDQTVQVTHGPWGKTVFIDDDALALLPVADDPGADDLQELQRSAE